MITILIISPEPWNAHFVSKHHYAITLASEGAKVYFLNPPDDRVASMQISTTKYKNLYTITDKRVARGLRFYPRILREYIQKKWLERVEKSIGERFDTIWLFENSRFYDMEFAGDKLKIYHQVDLNQNFHIKEASSSADICFCTSDYILAEIKQYNQKTYKITHGLSQNKEPLNIYMETYFKQREINVVYIGNLDIAFLDIELLKSLITNYSDITFHLVGSYNKDKKTFTLLNKFTNIIWWGRVESAILPSILERCDMSLLAYRTNSEYDKEQLANPHKLMEYLSSGKVVVATYTDEYKDKRELLEMVDDSSDYINKFDEVVKDLDFYNSEDKQKQRVDFAKEHSYDKQLLKIKGKIQCNKKQK